MKTNCIFGVYRLFFLAISGAGIAACTNPAADTAEAETRPRNEPAATDVVTLSAAQARAIGLQTGNLDTLTVSDEVTANGIVDVPPQQMASVSLPIAGYVRTLRKLPGSAVAKGEILAVLESLDYVQMQQDYLQARSRLTFQDEELQRQTTLNAEEVGARRRLQQARADYESTRALVNALEVKLRLLGAPLAALQRGQVVSQLSVRAPIGGYIRHVNVMLGQNVSPADVLIELIGVGHKHLELKVFEKDAYKLKDGQKLVLTAPVFSEKPEEGFIYLVGKTLEGEAKTLSLHGHVIDPAVERRLLPGMYVSARILTGSRRAATLPDEAILSEGDKRYIFIEEKSLTFRKVPVSVGRSASGRTEVLPQNPLMGKPIVRKGAYLLNAATLEKEEEE